MWRGGRDREKLIPALTGDIAIPDIPRILPNARCSIDGKYRRDRFAIKRRHGELARVPLVDGIARKISRGVDGNAVLIKDIALEVVIREEEAGPPHLSRTLIAYPDIIEEGSIGTNCQTT